jgi:hypothetical protein
MFDIVVRVAATSILGFGLVLFLIQVLAGEIGFRLGRRSAAAQAARPEGIGVVVGGMLGLLSFVLAITLSFASMRYEERRQGTVAEANAIGTAWLRAKGIGHARGDAIAAALEDYLRLRLAFTQADKDSTTVNDINARTGRLQARIWQDVSALIQERQDIIAHSLMAAVNDVFDRATDERFAFNQVIPAQLVWLLLGMTTLTVGALGFDLGVRRPAMRGLALLLVGMWTLVVVVILDLAAARLGGVRVDGSVYSWTMSSMGGRPIVPPAR